uniref:Uncharacterized protein n=1 Tax=Arion vulgaris TaxID=1028688 RepID=A0A0B7AMY1_9EUPU
MCFYNRRLVIQSYELRDVFLQKNAENVMDSEEKKCFKLDMNTKKPYPKK